MLRNTLLKGSSDARRSRRWDRRASAARPLQVAGLRVLLTCLALLALSGMTLSDKPEMPERPPMPIGPFPKLTGQ